MSTDLKKIRNDIELLDKEMKESDPLFDTIEKKEKTEDEQFFDKEDKEYEDLKKDIDNDLDNIIVDLI